MGIVNVTPDSFSDGGRFAATERAVAHGLELVRQGADLLDVGGESTPARRRTRPLEEELRRVVPVVRGWPRAPPCRSPWTPPRRKWPGKRSTPAPTSSTTSPRCCGDPDMAEVVRAFGAGVVLMHMQGTPPTMQQQPDLRRRGRAR